MSADRSPHRATLRSGYLYLVCLITLVMVIFGAQQAVRQAVELAYPDRMVHGPVCVTEFGFEGKDRPMTDAERQRCEEEQKRNEQAAQDSQRRYAILGLVSSGTLILIAGPAYLYHWRRIQRELPQHSDGPVDDEA